MTYVLHDWFPAPQAMIPFSNGLSNSMMPNGWQSRIQCRYNTPDRKVYGANMGPTLDQQEPGGPHVGPWTLLRVSSGQGKVREIPDLAKVREKSGNFVEGQGKSEYWEKSGKSQGICI